MRILIAGGVYGLSEEARTRRRPAPEVVLEGGLRAAGADVRTISLKDFRAGLRPSGYDIVHVHHMSKMAVAQAVVRRPMVFTHHASTYGATLVQRAAERVVWQQSDRIVCLSENERRDKIANFPRLADKFTVIPNGIPDMASGQAPVRRRWTSGETFTVAVVGQLIELKRVHLALQALTALPDFVHLELTYHNNHLESALRDLACALGVSDRVAFLGQASGETLHRRYQRANLLLLTSYTEALPSVVSEALVTGCPVVATDVGGVREQVGPAGVLVDRDRATYGEAVLAAIAGYDTLAEGAVTRGSALQDEYSPEAMARQHLELYRDVLEAA